MKILGISAFYHDSAAALVVDGHIVAAAQEERFTRIKHDDAFPLRAIQYVLAEAGISVDELDGVAFYEKPLTKFHRILQTHFSVAPQGWRAFVMAMPLWLKQKLWIPLEIEKAMEACGALRRVPLYFTSHHESHAASAFFPSPYARAAILTLDGVGEWDTVAFGRGEQRQLELLQVMHFPHSPGLLYSAFTYFCGFKVNSGEYKLMGLAPYGEPRYVNTIREHLIDLKADGSFVLNTDYFGYLDGLTMTNDRFAELFGGPARQPESDLTQREMDLARSIQDVTEEMLLRMGRHIHAQTGEQHLCLAGGVALNCVANGRLLREGPFDDIWIQPAAGDAGGALGAALCLAYRLDPQAERVTDGQHDTMQGAYLGPQFSDADTEAYLMAKGYPARRVREQDWAAEIARHVDEQKVVGLCHGRMEFGPRALGNRSIIGDARSPRMQSVMNLKIKYRESFRPFAPSCLEERVGDYFELDRPSPYMLLVAPVRAERRSAVGADVSLKDRIHQVRSDVPAITHVDYSARIQTVSERGNRPYYDILKAFERRTGEGILINTSFNVRGEPVVCTPEDAYRCFMRTEMDVLVLGSFILDKRAQPEWQETTNWRADFQLD